MTKSLAFLLHRHVLLPAFERGLKGRSVFRYWKELEQSQWLPRPELETNQRSALRRLLAYASGHCPYYRREWKQRGLDPNAVGRLEDFHCWPTIDRETVSRARERMRSHAPGVRLLSKSTGGSTGVPLHFDYDTESLDHRFAAWHRGYNWAGAGPGTKQFYFWGIPLGERGWRQRRKDGLYHWLYRRRVLSSFDFRESQAEAVLAAYNRYRPEVLIAYTNPLYHLARTLEERRLTPRPPRSVVVGAEKLYDFQRAAIERVFQAPVFETYGSREFMLLGAECDRHRGLHLSFENCLVEVLDDDGRPSPDGVEGNVVVTDLTNYGMPFVRYANGDRAVAGWGTCPCGRGLPLLRRVVGRQLDVIRTPDGRLVPGEFFPHLLKDFPAVRRFQVVQTAPDRVELRLVLGASWVEADRRKIDREVVQVLGPDMRYEVRAVDHIAPTAGGKFRVVVGLAPAAAS
jgi:phenylacetate-CoA ligase